MVNYSFNQPPMPSLFSSRVVLHRIFDFWEKDAAPVAVHALFSQGRGATYYGETRFPCGKPALKWLGWGFIFLFYSFYLFFFFIFALFSPLHCSVLFVFGDHESLVETQKVTPRKRTNASLLRNSVIKGAERKIRGRHYSSFLFSPLFFSFLLMSSPHTPSPPLLHSKS